MVGPMGLGGLARGPVTPGIFGISDLKRAGVGRSDGGWSGILFSPCTDFILETSRIFKTQEYPSVTREGVEARNAKLEIRGRASKPSPPGGVSDVWQTKDLREPILEVWQ